jgi:hypothetical protein
MILIRREQVQHLPLLLQFRLEALAALVNDARQVSREGQVEEGNVDVDGLRREAEARFSSTRWTEDKAANLCMAIGTTLARLPTRPTRAHSKGMRGKHAMHSSK